MTKSPQSHLVKGKSASLSLNHASKVESLLLALLILFLPTQFGKHFWPDFAYVNGIRIDYLSPTLYVTDLIVILLAIVFIARVGIGPLLQWILPRKILLTILGFFFLTALFAERVPLGFYWWVKLVEFNFVGIYIAHTINSRAQVYVLTLLLSIGVFFESFLAILQYLQQGSLNGWLYFLGERTFIGSTLGIANASIDGALVLRPYGTFPHPNVLAGFLLLTSVLISYMLIFKSRGFIRFYGMLIVAFGTIALFLSLSRVVIGIWFALLCGTLLWMVLRRTKPFHNRIAFALVIGSIISLVILPFSQIVVTRFAETSFSEEALVQRSELITTSLSMLESSPFFGVGFGNFIPVLSPLQPPLSLGLYLQPVHNIYLLLATETGLIGLIMTLGVLALTFQRLIQFRTTENKTLYAIFGLLLSIILLIGFFDHYFLTLQQGQLLFAVVLGLCWTKLRPAAL